MTKKDACVSINKWESTMLPLTEKIMLGDAGDIEVTVRRRLPLRDMLQFVEDVVSSCVHLDDMTYTPEVKWFAINKGILTMYANFRMPNDIEKQYDLIYNTDALKQVLSVVDDFQLDEIVEAINSRIEYELTTIHACTALQNVEQAASRLDRILEQVEARLSKTLALDKVDATPAEIAAVIKKLASMNKIDEGKLAHAVLEEQRNHAPMVADDNVIPLRRPEA